MIKNVDYSNSHIIFLTKLCTPLKTIVTFLSVKFYFPFKALYILRGIRLYAVTIHKITKDAYRFQGLEII